jgi:DNA-binding transcriptional LysR family regulator
VSQHVAHLEATVGRTLLTRRPVALTDAGARLVEHAAHILLRVDVARSELALASETPQHLRIVMTPLADARQVSHALRSVRSTTPALRIEVHTSSADEAVASVAGGSAELAVVDGTVAAGNPLQLADAGLLASFVVSEERLAVVVPHDHPLRGDKVDLDTLTDAWWIAVPRIAHGPSGVPGYASSAPSTGFTFDGDDIVTLIELVAAGHGLAMLPTRLCEHAHGVRALHLDRPALVQRTEVLALRTSVERCRPIIDQLRRPVEPPG